MDDRLQRLAAAEEIQIAPVRHNGEPRRPAPIWVVRAGDAGRMSEPMLAASFRRKR
jgi:hypothetical protein